MAHPNPRMTERDDGALPAPARPAFSAFLLEARRAAGLSVEDVAAMTKVPARHLDALEQGRIDELPRGVYRRGILRTYASAVGLDPSLVLERFSQAFGTDAAFSEWEVVAPPTRARHAAPVRPAGVATDPGTFVSRRRPIEQPGAKPAPMAVRPTVRPRTLGIVAGAVLVTLLLAYPLMRSDSSTSVVMAPGVSPEASTSPAPAAAGVVPVVDNQGPRRGDVRLPPQPGASTTDALSAADTEADGSPVQTESRLVVTSSPPGARVTVDGIGWGVTPVTIRHLPPGVKRVRVTLDGYAGQNRDIRIGDDGGVVTARIVLQPRD